MTLLVNTLREDTASTALPQGQQDRVDGLFPEAEEHQRFRRARLGVVGVLLLLSAGAVIGALGAHDGSHPPTFGLSSRQLSSSVAYATSHAETARISIAEDTGADRCVERSLPRAVGEVSFTQQTMFVQWPSTACGAVEGGLLTSSEIVNGTQYAYFPSRTRSGRAGPSVWHRVLQPVQNGLSEFFEPVGQAASPAPWRILDALRGPVTVVGRSSIRGAATTEYRGTASLASLIATYPSIRSHMNGVQRTTPLSQLIVPASKVAIGVLVWLDSDHRIRRVVLSEPEFEANVPHTRDGRIAGFDLSPTMTIAKDPSRPGPYGPAQQETVRYTDFRVIGTFRLGIDLYDFGAPVHISAPSTDHVAAS